MWKLLEQAAKTASANASEYVSTVQEKAQSLVATVQDEAATLLHAIGSARTGPVDELLYEEMDDYKEFLERFKIDSLTDEISQILEQDDEIRGLHEQMVPVQLSYEDFWSRYFFRREQDELRQQREAERKQKQREQDEAKAAAKAVLEEFQVDDEDEDEFDTTATTTDDANDDLDDASLDKAHDAEEGEATLAQLREARASRKAAQQWKQKALEYQKQLGVLAAKHEDEKETLKTTMESQYQSLCDSYESKMAEVTTQIDDARAVGYQEGIDESEAIVTTMRQESDNEINRLNMAIAQLQQRELAAGATAEGGEVAGGGASMAELDRLMDALTLKEQVVAALEENKSELEKNLAEKEEALQKALSSSASTAVDATQSSEVEEAKKETELWKLRAVKMKKMKEQIETELQQLKEQQVQLQAQQPASTESSSEEIVALRARLSELELHNQELTTEQTRLQALGEQEFERGVQTMQSQLESQLQQLKEEMAQATQQAEANAAAAFTSEIESLRSELALLRAQQQAAAVGVVGATIATDGGDVLAQADAVLSSLDASDLLDDASWTAESDSTTTAATGAAKPDWGEW